jgi:phytoene dehydrogenase-like protein
VPRSPSSDRADVVIVGGGHNGLICGAYLARAGLDVLVLERNSRCGGALFSTVRDGFSLEHGAIDHSTVVASTIPDDLGLERHGLRYLHRTNSALHLFGDGTQIAIAATAEETARSIAAVDRVDADAWMALAEVSSGTGSSDAVGGPPAHPRPPSESGEPSSRACPASPIS